MRIHNQKPLSQVQKEKDKKQKQEESIGKVPSLETDVSEVAQTAAYVLMDAMATAETVAMLLMEVENLKQEVNVLKGGNE